MIFDVRATTSTRCMIFDVRPTASTRLHDLQRSGRRPRKRPPTIDAEGHNFTAAALGYGCIVSDAQGGGFDAAAPFRGIKGGYSFWILFLNIVLEYCSVARGAMSQARRARRIAPLAISIARGATVLKGLQGVLYL